MENGKKVRNFFTKLLTYILMVLLVLGVAGGIVYIVALMAAPSGTYVEYDGESYFADNGGLAIEWEDGSYTAQFYIKNTDGWGEYSVTDSVVKVIPNVSDSKNFDFTVGENNYSYGSVSDLTAAFTTDYSSYAGDGIAVAEDGGFTLYFDTKYLYSNIDSIMSTVLTRVYGETVTISETYDVSAYPYFALQVTTPDGETVIKIPFTVYGSGRVITVL